MDNLEFDWSHFTLEDDSSNWRNYYNFDQNYAINFIQFLNRSVALKHEKVISKILANFVICNSKLAKVLPILFIYGKPGSGKSYLSYLLASFRGQNANILGSATTFAAIRNQLQSLRWKNKGTPLNTTLNNENPYLLIWSDIKENTIDDKMYSLLRNGCYRSEEKIFISEGSGNNLPFYVFGQKIISSTDNFFIKPQWSELFRRCLFIRMYHFNELDKNYISEFNKRDLLDIYNIDYRHIAHEYNQFWDSDRILRVKSLYNSKLKLAKTIKDNYAIPELALSISLDLIIQGLAADLYDNQDDAFSTWSNFWQLSSEELGTTQKPILLHIIDTIIEEKIAEFEAQKQQFIKYNRLDLIPDTITISPSTIKQRIDDAKSDGLIEIIKTSEVKEIMLSKGFDLVSHNKKFCYSKKAD